MDYTIMKWMRLFVLLLSTTLYSNGLERNQLVYNKMNCDTESAPKLNLSENQGQTCLSNTIIVENNTFSGEGVFVESISSNGHGKLDISKAMTSPFSFTYTPSSWDAGKLVSIHLITNSPVSLGCPRATATFELMVNDQVESINPISHQSFCPISEPTVADLIINGGPNVVWFTDLSSEIPLPETTPLQENTSYFAEIEGYKPELCNEPKRAEVIVDFNCALEARHDQIYLKTNQLDYPIVLNVLDNDVIQNDTVNLNEVRLQVVKPDEKNVIHLDLNGELSITENAPNGLYIIEYSICELANPNSCSSAQVIVEVDDRSNCITYGSIIKQDIDSCSGNDGWLKIDVDGLNDGDYTGKFFYGMENEIPFNKAKIENGILLLEDLTAGEYFNIRYISDDKTKCYHQSNYSVILHQLNTPTKPFEDNSLDQVICNVGRISPPDYLLDINLPKHYSLAWYDAKIGGKRLTYYDNIEPNKNYYVASVNIESGCESQERSIIHFHSNDMPEEIKVDHFCSGKKDEDWIRVLSPVGNEYEYSLNDGEFQPEPLFENLFDQHSYRITVKNQNGCSVSQMFQVACEYCFHDIDDLEINKQFGYECNSGDVQIKGSFDNYYGLSMWANVDGEFSKDIIKESPFEVKFTPEKGISPEEIEFTFLPHGGMFCYDTKTVRVAIPQDHCLSKNDFEFNDKLVLYPNPVQDVFSVSAQNIVSIEEIQVNTVQGQLLFVTRQSEVNVSNLSKGIYIVKVKTNKGFSTTRLVKE